MKTFRQILQESSVLQEMKYKGHTIDVKKSTTGKDFSVFVDGDEIDSNYKTEKKAIQGGKEFVDLMKEEE